MELATQIAVQTKYLARFRILIPGFSLYSVQDNHGNAVAAWPLTPSQISTAGERRRCVMAALNIAEKRERYMMRRVGHSHAPVLKAAATSLYTDSMVPKLVHRHGA
jgi:hypothetical protein